MALHSAAASCPRCGTLTTCVSEDPNAKTVSGSCPLCGAGMTLALIPNTPHGIGAPGVKPGFHQGMITDPPATAVDPALVDEGASVGGTVEYGSAAVLPGESQDALRAAPAPGSYGVPVDANRAHYPVEPTPSGAHPDSEAAQTDVPAQTYDGPQSADYYRPHDPSTAPSTEH